MRIRRQEVRAFIVIRPSAEIILSEVGTPKR
jgi:hypothetical protein